MKQSVALGLSGGVDSAVSALLLKQQGYEVHCIYLNCFDDDVPGLRPRGVSDPSTVKSAGLSSPRGCRTKEDRKDALAVALHLGLPFQVLDFRKEYQASVIDYFKREYEAGRTPNPDVVCNRDIKFGLFYQWALRRTQGKRFDYMATGHYAKLQAGDKRQVTDNRKANKKHVACCLLHVAKDSHKDQTYFLWQVPRERFERVLFPLGDYLKSEVREIARKAKLPVADKPDSTGICFIGEVRVEDFLKRLGVKEKQGDVVIRVAQNPKSETLNPKQIQNSNDSNKQNKKSLETLDLEHSNLFRNSDLEIRNSDAFRVIGRHKGVAFYTIGQRHGFSADLWSTKNKDEGRSRPSSFGPHPSADRPPLYVIEKDVERNRLIVGFGAECYRSQFQVSDLNWLIPNTEYWILNTSHILVRIRHGGELIPCSLSAIRNPLKKKNESRITIRE